MIGGQTRECIARSYEQGGNKAPRTDPIDFALVSIYLISITALHFRFRFQLTALPVLCAHREILTPTPRIRPPSSPARRSIQKPSPAS
jgi:hypothetical protein